MLHLIKVNNEIINLDLVAQHDYRDGVLYLSNGDTQKYFTYFGGQAGKELYEYLSSICLKTIEASESP